MTFPIKKRTIIIDRNKGLYMQTGDKETDQENISIKKWIREYLTSWRMSKLKQRESNCRNEITAACLE